MLSRGVTSMRTSQPMRGMATAQALRQRVESVKSTRKITTAQKMIATFKLRKVASSVLYVGLSGDKGFCGAINSSIVRSVRDNTNKFKAEGGTTETAKIMIMGERGRGGLERHFKNHFTVSITDYEKVRSFKQCAELADLVLGHRSIEKTQFFYQKFNSMISYSTKESTFWNYELIKDDLATAFSGYEMEGDNDIMQNLYEFKTGVKLHHYLAELDASTLSSRVQSMTSASQNAFDLIEDLTLVLNRARQARITTEISEIISGASAADEQK